jgi:hypothetical protein
MRLSTLLYRAGWIILCSGAVAACGDSSPLASVSRPAPIDTSLTAAAAARGFSANNITDFGDYLLVEGDILLAKRDLLASGAALHADRYRAGAPSGQYYTTYTVSQARMARGIKVAIGHLADSNAWVSAAREALKQWGLSANTKIQLVEASDPADITLDWNSLPSGTIAASGFPTGDGSPGPHVWVSYSYQNSLTQSQKTWVIIHELGHALGFRHTNWQALGESQSPYGANWISGTPTGTDNSSVMLGGAGAKSWNGFDSYDQVANQTRFPTGAVTLTSQTYDASGHPTFAWSNANVPETNLYRIYYTWEEPYWEYDPTFPDGGYWTTQWLWSDLGTTTAMTFTDVNAVRNGDSSCNGYYYIQPYYPSGKGTHTTSTVTFETC